MSDTLTTITTAGGAAAPTSVAQAFARVVYPVIAGDAAVQDRAREAEARGHAAGYAAGLRAAQAEATAWRDRVADEAAAVASAAEARLTTLLATLAAATAGLHARTAPVLADAEATMVAAAMELAEAVVGHEIRTSRPGAGEAHADAGARATVARALATVDPTVVVTLRLSPADAASLAGADLPVSVVADPSLRPGDAVTQLADGVVDARIASALDRARRALGMPTAATAVAGATA